MDKELLLRILSFAKPYSRFWPRYIAFIIPSTIFGILNLALVIPVLEVVFNNSWVEVSSKPEFSFSFNYFKDLFYYSMNLANVEWGIKGTLLFICISVAMASFLTNIFKYLSQMVLVSMRLHVNMNLRNVLFSKLTQLDVGYYKTKRKGDLMSTLSNDIGEIQNSIITSFQTIFREPIMLIGYLAALFYISYQLTLFSMVAVPISAYLIGLLSKKLKRDAGAAQKYQGELMSIMDETIGGIRIIKGFNAQKYVLNKFMNTNNLHLSSSRKVANRQELASPMSEFFGVSVILSILYFGGTLVLNKQLDMSTSEFVAFIGLYYFILTPIKELTKAYPTIVRGMVSAQRVFAILDEPIGIQDKSNAKVIEKFEKEIKFENVSFMYSDGDSEVLHNINLSIPKGKMYALVGHSGAGKSTIADLIPRFYDVTEGVIKIDDYDLRDLKQESITHLMGIVSQESILFNDTIFNNIAFGIKCSQEEVQRAAEIANAHEFIVKMDDGYQTNIGDRGGRLSGGQRQRISIARAVLRNPPILILDEATSALDTESERLVQDALFKLMKNRTSIVIAHRLSTIQHADCIIVLQDGQIIEQGSHEDLINQQGAYYNLCKIQNFKQI